jgi:hypothetical protein
VETDLGPMFIQHPGHYLIPTLAAKRYHLITLEQQLQGLKILAVLTYQRPAISGADQRAGTPRLKVASRVRVTA